MQNVSIIVFSWQLIQFIQFMLHRYKKLVLTSLLWYFNFVVKDRHFVEITMCYHAIHNLEEIKKRSEEIIDIQKELKSSIYVLNYRFIREYTEGVKDAWTINAINHLKAEEHDKTIL